MKTTPDLLTALTGLVQFNESDPDLYVGDDDGTLSRLMFSAHAAIAQAAPAPDLLEALERLEIQANHAYQLQKAGTRPGPFVWSDLNDSCRNARDTINKAELDT